MKYMLSIYGDASEWDSATPEEGAQLMAAYDALDRELRAAGALVAGEALERPETATTVRVRDGERLLTDGPFAETREQLGGFYVLECANLDEAIAWAARIPNAADGSVEVRPVMEFDEPAASPADDDTAARA
jgi:hypothetical protein